MSPSKILENRMAEWELRLSEKPGAIVAVVESEAEAKAGRYQFGAWAWISVGGAFEFGSLRSCLAIRGRHLFLVPKSDHCGRTGADMGFTALMGLCSSVSVMDLFPDRTDGYSVRDYVAELMDGPTATKVNVLPVETTLGRRDHKKIIQANPMSAK